MPYIETGKVDQFGKKEKVWRRPQNWVYDFLYKKHKAEAEKTLKFPDSVYKAMEESAKEYHKVTGNYAPCAYCGSTRGTEDMGDGWERCKDCGGN